MWRSNPKNNVALMTLIAVITAVTLTADGSAFAAMKPSSTWSMQGKLFGNIPNVTVRNVQAGGAPWVVQGSYRLTSNHFYATGKWLVVPKQGYMQNGMMIPKAIAGTTVGVKSVVADITFANAKSVITAPVMLSKNGDFTFNTSIMIPKGAADPVILIGPGTQKAIKVWFASSNFLMDYGMANKQSVGMGASSSMNNAMGSSMGGSSSSGNGY